MLFVRAAPGRTVIWSSRSAGGRNSRVRGSRPAVRTIRRHLSAAPSVDPCRDGLLPSGGALGARRNRTGCRMAVRCQPERPGRSADGRQVFAFSNTAMPVFPGREPIQA